MWAWIRQWTDPEVREAASRVAAWFCAYPWEQLRVEQVRELVGYAPGTWDGGQLGTKAFSYRVTRFDARGEHGTLWILGFFGTVDFVVVTGSPLPTAPASP